jgi:hypothetical protein
MWEETGIFARMKTILSLVMVVIAGVAGLAFVFTDVLVAPPGFGRIAVGGVFYVVVGFALARLQSGGRPVRWALASGWGLAALGVVGLWISLSDRSSADFGLAFLFLLGPALAAVLGSWIGGRAREPLHK